jgi:uncharacterized protein
VISSYQRRIVDGELDELLPGLAAISLEGAKGVGKTATALRRADDSLALDDPAARELVQADPRRIDRATGLLLLDEWQRLPEVWDQVRRAVDADPRPGRFVLTGSATPTSSVTHSGAGRIVTVRMRPMSLAERGLVPPTVSVRGLLTGGRPAIEGRSTLDLAGYAEEIVRSGFPGIRTLTGRGRRAQLDGYLDRVVEHDFPEQGHLVRRPATLRRWLSAYAAATATTTSYNVILDAATPGDTDKPAKTTTIAYRDVLAQLWLLDPVPGWSPARNHFARLGSAPKHHLADPALAARLLGLDRDALLSAAESGRHGSMIGPLFESLVTLSVRTYAQAAEARVSHLRTRNGDREVDLVVERADGRIVALEVKLGRLVDDRDTVHLRWLRDRLGDDLLDAAVVTTGDDAYRRLDGVAVIPAALLGP